MREYELKIGQVIKLGSDTYKVTKIKADIAADCHQGFNAQRFIKTRKTWSHQPHFLKFDYLERCEIIK